MSNSKGRNLLPRLRGDGVPQGTLGGWTTMSTPEELAKLDFGAYEEQGLRTRIQSIPSPWARLLLFRHGLEDEDHPARDLIVNELLDAFEFLWSYRSRPGTSLDWLTVRIEDLRGLAEQTQSLRVFDFAAALVELAPPSTGGPAGGAAIDAITIAVVHDRPVLASSPYTGVFTAEDAAGEGTSTFFRYSVEGVLRPLKTRPRAFQDYVAGVIVPQLGQGAPLAHGAYREWQTLRRVLGTWLRREVAAAGHPAGGEDFQDAARRLGLERFEVPFGGLELFHRRAGGDLEHSRWRLRSERAGQHAPLVLDATSFDGEYYEGASRVPLPDLGTSDREILPGLGQRYPWVQPSTDWLSERILLLNEPLEMANVRGLEHYQWRGAAGDPRFATPRMTLPLKADFFRYFAAEDVDRMLTVHVHPAGEVEVILRIPVGSEERPGEVVVRKSYPASQLEEPGPGLAVWPPFRDERWHHYVVFRQDSNRQLADYVELLAIGADGQPIPGDRVRRTELVTSLALGEAPSVLEFRSALTTGAGSRSLGVVLPRYRPTAAPSGARWHVGVDFGTSNTVMAIRQEDEPTPWLFEASSLILPLTEPAETTRPIMDGYFFPEHIPGRPFGTAVVHLKERPDIPFSQEAIGARVTVPFGGHVYADDRNRVVGDLKWSADRDAFYLSSSFLRHTLATVVAAAIQRGVDPSRITISWAYPRAFTPTQRSFLESQWEQVVDSLRDTGLQADAIRESLDESRSVLRHFFNLGQLTVVGEAQAVLDVGGGTTDIAAYGAGKVLLLDSVMLGGRNLTGPTLRPVSMPERVNPFVVSFYVWAVRNDLPAPEREVFRAYVEAGHIHLAFSYLVGTRWFQEGRASQFAATREFQSFQLIVLYAFGGLMHYLGMPFRALAEESGAAEPELPHTIILAGNGSRYLSWLINLRPLDQENEFFGILARLVALAAGSPDADLPRVRVTRQPKHEVARGLVAQTTTGALDERGHASTSLMGESVRLRDVEYRTTSRLRSDEVVTSADVARLEWLSDEMEIQRYHRHLLVAAEELKTYGGVWGKAGAEYQAFFQGLNRRDLRQEVMGRLGFLAQKEGGFQGSIFILEVAAVLEQMLQELFPEVKG